MKFLVPNYSCLDRTPPDPRSLCPELNLLNPPPRRKFLGTPLPADAVFLYEKAAMFGNSILVKGTLYECKFVGFLSCAWCDAGWERMLAHKRNFCHNENTSVRPSTAYQHVTGVNHHLLKPTSTKHTRARSFL